eukprot:765974-Hanusia_phi.AAC.1
MAQDRTCQGGRPPSAVVLFPAPARMFPWATTNDGSRGWGMKRGSSGVVNLDAFFSCCCSACSGT